MTNEEKVLLADRVIALLSDFKQESEPIPVAIGTLKKAWGLNGFKLAEIGNHVFEYKGKYLLYLENLNGTQSVEIPFNKEALSPIIDFFEK